MLRTGQGGFEITQAQCAATGETFLPGVADGAYWQLQTSAFTHLELWHIGFNMLALWVLGPQLELAIGRARFIALYLLSGPGRVDAGLLAAGSRTARPSVRRVPCSG